jgi:hypothetical protein
MTPPKTVTPDQPQAVPDERLWWFLHVLDACGKRGTHANDEPGEWVAAFCGDVEPKDTFNRACDLKLAGCSHNTMDETSRVWITDAGKAWLAARPVLPVETPSEGLREALTEALVVMRLATGFPAVENEIDLWPAIKSATAALASTAPATVPGTDRSAT